jgi:hypothetical protein
MGGVELFLGGLKERKKKHDDDDDTNVNVI